MKIWAKDSEEYKAFRKAANLRNKKYSSKPSVKLKKQIYKKQYDIDNKEQISEYGHKRRSKPEYISRIKKWREDNKEHLRLKGVEWREKNMAKKRANDRAYSKKLWSNPITRAKEIERQEGHRKDNPELIKKSRQKYNQSLKGKLTSTKFVHKRLARIHGNGFDLTKEQIKKIWERDKVCVYCGGNKKLELDHLHPLSRGGETTYNNIVIACKKCNCSKGAKDVIEWCKSRALTY